MAAGTPVCPGDVVHQTMIDVDEGGTVAAAATVVSVNTTVAQDAPLITIDRPFFYAIEDDTSGTLLFVGVMMNPNAG